jgi:hypothetical protein
MPGVLGYKVYVGSTFVGYWSSVGEFVASYGYRRMVKKYERHQRRMTIEFQRLNRVPTLIHNGGKP